MSIRNHFAVRAASNRRNLRSSTNAAVLLAAAITGAALTSTSYGDLVVNTNLGALGAGSTPLVGTTVGGPNNASTYVGANSAATWFEEYVYQFTTSSPLVISLTSNDPNLGPSGPDNDFFLLNSLTVSGSPTTAQGVIPSQPATGFSGVEVSGGWGVQPAGTYYLSIDAFRGAAGNPSTATTFNAQLTLAPFVPPQPPPSTDVVYGGSLSGTLAAGEVKWYKFTLGSAQAVSFDTEGTTLSGTNDTELFLFDSSGNLLGTDDDDGTGNLSHLESGDELPAIMPAGTYYLGFGGFNTSSTGTAFNLTSTSTQTGNFIINGITLVPEPASVAMVGILAGAALKRRARAR